MDAARRLVVWVMVLALSACTSTEPPSASISAATLARLPSAAPSAPQLALPSVPASTSTPRIATPKPTVLAPRPTASAPTRRPLDPQVDLLPAPSSFDASTLTWWGDENGVTPPINQYFFGTFDGRSIEYDPTRYIDAVVPMDRGRVAVGASRVVYVDGPTQARKRLMRGTPYGFDAANDAVFAEGLDGGLWRAPAGGSKPTLVLPLPSSTADRGREVAVASLDGMVVATGSGPGEYGRPHIQARWGDAPGVVLPVTGLPVGVDDRGRIVFIDATDQGSVAMTYVQGAVRGDRIPGLDVMGSPAFDGRLRLVAGRYVVLTRVDEATHSSRVFAHDLHGDPGTSWDIVRSWWLTDLGGARYAIFFNDFGSETAPDPWYAVVDPSEGWLAFVHGFKPMVNSRLILGS
jgi:hypothetical protein